jgi:hypothetical protein
MWILCLAVVAAAAVNIDGGIKIMDREKLGIPMDMSIESLVSSVVVTVLEGGREVASANVDNVGKFSLPTNHDGRYTLYFSHPTLQILPVIAVVDGGVATGLRYDAIRFEEESEIPYPFVISPVSNNSPYVPEERFDALQLFKNPMVIMGLVMVALLYIMPKLQGNMSPEDMQEMRKGLEEDGGFAANFLKSMIPAATGGNAHSANSVPSISSDSENRRRK